MSLDTPVVVKENLIESEEAQRQFSREAGLLAKLRHPHLPRVIDHFLIADQGQVLVMDYIEGEDLNQVLSREGRVPQAQALQWIGQVLSALEYLHGQNIIHRDVKPANVKITPEGTVDRRRPMRWTWSLCGQTWSHPGSSTPRSVPRLRRRCSALWRTRQRTGSRRPPASLRR